MVQLPYEGVVQNPFQMVSTGLRHESDCCMQIPPGGAILPNHLVIGL